jgi:hypothetical protein
MPVILAIWETKIRRIKDQGQLRQIAISKIANTKKGWQSG